MHRRITLAATALLATTALLLTACTGGGTEPSPSSPGTPDPGATLTVGLLLEPSNLDIRHQSGAALEQALIDNVYEGLVTRDADAGNEVVPRLASDWEVSSDGLTYTFTIRDDVTFHDGTPMTSADVVSSLTAAKDDETIQGHADLQGVATIEAPDATTVVVTLTEPNSNFLFNLTGRAGIVVKTGDTTDLKTAANGTGPFTVGTWLQGDSLTLERNEAYWGDPAGVAEVVLTYFADSTAAVNAALEGSVDVVTEVDPELAPQLEGDVGYTLVSGETTDKGTLAFNNKKAPLDDVRVREALRLAIDHDALIETLGSGDTLFGPIPPLDPGYEDLSDVVTHDPAKAKELLAEAGVKNLTLTLTIPSVYGTTIPTILVSDFNEIGVTLKVDSVEFTSWLQDVYTNKDYDLSFVRHVEARDFSNWANPDYYFNYDNPKVQSLYAEALASTDEAETQKLLAEAARIVSEDHAADWLFLATPIAAVGTNVSGFPENSLNVRLPLAGATVSTE